MDIKLMNYGRGAGKTYTLKKWADEAAKRVIFTDRPENYRRTTNHVVHIGSYNWKALDGSRLEGYLRRHSGNFEVAFDDFDIRNKEHQEMFSAVAQYNPTLVILATSYGVMKTEADTPKAMTTQFFFGGVPKSLIVDGAIQRPLPKDIGEPLTGDAKIGFAKATAEAAERAHKEPEEGNEEAEPVQSVKARDLRLGDWIEGKGAVTGIYPSSIPSEAGQLRVLLEDKSLAFTGTIVIGPGHLLDVDTTKRK